MLYGGYHLRPWEIGRLTPGQIDEMVAYERAYAYNAAKLVGYHSRSPRAIPSG